MPTRAVKTKRGYHLYYKIPDDIKITNNSKVITIGGFPVDYKTGANNKKAYAIVKFNGVEIPVINKDITEYPLPNFLSANMNDPLPLSELKNIMIALILE